MNELHLFAGVGGGILGGMLLGHTTVCAVELEPYCRRVLLQRQREGWLPRFPIWDDVTTFDGKPWRGKVDIVAGGFPCQDISSAGKGEGITGERSGLWKEMSRIICEVRPRYAFVENSPMLTSRGLGIVLGDLASMGYNARWGVLGADNLFAPHSRKRIWIVSELRGGGGHNMANSNSLYEQGNQCECPNKKEWKEQGEGSSRPCCPSYDGVSYTPSKRSQRSRSCWFSFDPAEIGEGKANQPLNDSIKETWGIESRVGRVAHGIPNRVDRLKALGNAQVPIVAATAFKILKP